MAKIQVLMSTYNGSRFIVEQIESILSQEGVEVDILVRDDGSTDDTPKLLSSWEKNGKLSWYTGKNIKPAQSFMDAVNKCPHADYYAFADQDDVWDSDKLCVAAEMIQNEETKSVEKGDMPVLYFSNARLVDEQLNFIKTMNINHNLTLASALMVNPAVGCTIVFNNALLKMLRVFQNSNIYMHDGWAYRLCISLGGKVVFDKSPHISYRQHNNNVVGGNQSIVKKYKRRISNTFFDKKRMRSTDAQSLLLGYSHHLIPENMNMIKIVAQYRFSLSNRISLAFDKRFTTGNTEHDVAFKLAVLLGAF